jgi:hypothetical protein
MNAYADAVKYVLFPSPDVQLSETELAKRSYDSLYAKVGDLPQAVLVLAFIEDDQHKWVSADRAMLVTKSGRIVKTTGFARSLLFSKNNGHDPLSLGLRQLKVGQQFERTSDWTDNSKTGYLQQFKIQNLSQVSLNLLQKNFACTLVEEEVIFPNNSSFINQFWFESRTGVLLKSRQKTAHFTDIIELTHISTAFRFLPRGVSSEN